MNDIRQIDRLALNRYDASATKDHNQIAIGHMSYLVGSAGKKIGQVTKIERQDSVLSFFLSEINEQMNE